MHLQYNLLLLLWDAGLHCTLLSTHLCLKYHLNSGIHIIRDAEMSRHLGTLQFITIEAKCQREFTNKEGVTSTQDAYNRDNKYEVSAL
jgi:hypothetical protein